MFAKRKHLSIFGIISIFVFAGAIGCGGDKEELYQPPPQQEAPSDPEPFDNYQLTLVGWQTINLNPGQKVSLQVRYTNHGKPVPHEQIQFSFLDNPLDSSLYTYTAQTNANGYAENPLTAGQLPGGFRIEARALKAGPVQWTVYVQQVQEPPQNQTKILTGNFKVTSTFDIQTDFAGSNLADVLNMLNAMSDDPEDPGKFVVDQVLAQVDEAAVQFVATLLKSTLYSQVNNLLLSTSPDLVTDIKQLAFNLSSIARKFQMKSSISAQVDQPGHQVMVVDHTLNAMAWSLNGQYQEYTFSQLGMSEPKAKDVKVSLNYWNNNQLTIEQHTFKLSYGAFLLVALNNLVIPQLLQGANSLEDLLMAHINCSSVGQTMNNTVNIGGNSLWTAACQAGVTILADVLKSKIAELDSGDSTLSLTGISILRDMNNDNYFDTMNDGRWSGLFVLDNCQALIDNTTNTFWAVAGQ